MDVFGAALADQFNNNADTLWLHNNYGEKEEMPVDVFFRHIGEMPGLELEALKRCRGKVLDIGAGVGSHTWFLQQSGMDVTALEISEMACGIMSARGIKKVLNQDIFEYQQSGYDTLLLLMNGIGLAGTLEKLPALLKHLRSFLRPGGQILFDSSDISYLYEDIEKPQDRYFGEISYRYEYKNMKGEWFRWLYVDAATMKSVAEAAGFSFKLLFDDGMDQYLARLKSD